MDAELENKYFEWLYSRVELPHHPCWSLARQLHKKEFIWIVPNDDNRVEDGRELRYVFSHETRTMLTPDWHGFGVSMLEMLIALSERLAFQAERTTREWFWELMENVGLADYLDARYTKRKEREIDRILDRIIWRTYSYSGEGGLFPLEYPTQDQRKVELWYQMNAYIVAQY